MNILHYTIGLPPHRRGGSVQYAYDLMREQAKTHEVFALTCGDTLLRGNVCRIKKKGQDNGIQVYYLSNPITPTLIYGTKEPESQFRDVRIDHDNISSFIRKNKIEIMHIHTFMGMHLEVVKFIKSLGVRIIYTSHDFNGICPHYNLIDYDGELCRNARGERCAVCNQNEPSDKFLRLASSSLYQSIKQSGIFKLIRKPKPVSSESTAATGINLNMPADVIARYDKLLKYYVDYFHLIDRFHFNSSQTKEVFKHFLPFAKGDVIPVITSGIRDNRKELNPHEIIKFGFIGSTNDYKGFPLLKRILSKLYNSGITNFRLLVYAGGQEGADPDCPLIEYKPPYNYSEIDTILFNLDCVIVPSKWYETFSLVTLEALGHGRPVIVSDHVGAKDIVKEYSPQFIFHSEEELIHLLKSILQNSSALFKFNETILSSVWPFSIENHTYEIDQFYRRLC